MWVVGTFMIIIVDLYDME